MKLDLPDDATMSDIYKYLMEYTITHTMVQIPDRELHQYHKQLFNDLDDLFKHEHEIEEVRKISHYYQKIQKENKDKGQKDLTFDTMNSSLGRYSRFCDGVRSGEIIRVPGHDPTKDGLRRAVGDFGNDFCSSLGGYWTSLSDKAVPPTTSFQSMICKGLFTSTEVSITSAVTVDVDGVGTKAGASAVKATLYFHAPDSVTSHHLIFKFRKVTCSYGNGHNVKLTVIELQPESLLKARTRAEFDFVVTKSYTVPAWGKWLSFGINCAFDETKVMKSSSEQFYVELVCELNRFKIKQKPIINISIQDAREFLSLDKKMIEYQQKLGDTKELKMIKENCEKMAEEQLSELQKTIVNLGHDYLSKGFEMRKNLTINSWLLYLTFKSGAQTIYTVDVELISFSSTQARYSLRISPRNRAFSHMERALKKTSELKWEMILKQIPDQMPACDLNNLSGPAFEEIVNAKVMAKAAEVGVPLRCIEGDGIGQYIDASGNTVTTPEFVDAVFRNEATGDMISVQYKYSDAQWKLKETVQHWRDTWRNEDLSDVDIIVPKGLENEGEFGHVVKFSDEIVVEAPTPKQVKKWVKSNYDLMENIANESQGIKIKNNQIENFEKKIEKFKRIIEKKEEVISSGRGNDVKLKQDIQKKKEEVNKLQKEVNRATTEKGESEGKIQKVLDNYKRGAEKQEILDARIAEAGRELRYAVGLAVAISAATECICAFVDEYELWKEGKKTFGDAALHIFKRTAKASAVGLGVGICVGSIQYSFTRMALVESSNLLAGMGQFGSKIFGPALIAATMIFQSVSILKQYNEEKQFSPSVAKKRMAIDFVRMAGVTGGSIGAFAVSSALIASNPIGIAVGVIACITIGVGDYILGKWLHFDLQAYKELRPKVISKAYTLLGLEYHCSDKELKTAYRRALLKYHPDKAKNKDEANETTQAIYTAYLLLTTVRQE